MGEALKEHAIATFARGGSFTLVVDGEGKPARKVGGNVAGFFCTPEGEVLAFVVGVVGVEQLLERLRFARELREQLRHADGPEARRATARGAHEREPTHPLRGMGRVPVSQDWLAQDPLPALAELAPRVWKDLLGIERTGEGPKTVTLQQARELGLIEVG